MPQPSRAASITLWVLAFLLMAAAAVYQKTTGPTYPYRGRLAVADAAITYELLRSEETVREAVIKVPDPTGQLQGTLHWRRYPTDEPFTAVPLQPGRDSEPFIGAALPQQPAAGKLEYHLDLVTPAGPQRIPAAAGEEIVLRYKDPVPGYWLVPHIVVMFVSMMIGMRAVLSALWQPATVARHAWTTLVGLFAGGLVLGPIVQKYAFGAYWTGWPFGHDLTDNKHLLMWLCWLVACAVLVWQRRRPGLGRLAVALAGVVMIAVFLIPHSMRGSQLDYGKLDGGVDSKQAIGTGR
jgi:hypothetical protein